MAQLENKLHFLKPNVIIIEFYMYLFYNTALPIEIQVSQFRFSCRQHFVSLRVD